MNKEDIAKMARQAGMLVPGHRTDIEELERFAYLVAAAEREAIQDEFWMSLQSDLEHGVKHLNEKAAADYHKNYPGLVEFAGWLSARETHD